MRSVKIGSTKLVRMNSECSFLSVFDSVDCEIDLEDVQHYATLEDFLDPPADVIWMNRQFFNVLAQKFR